MEIGLLWFDDNKNKSLATKVYEAAAAYRAKPRFAGKTPNVCYAHPSTLAEVQEIRLNGMLIVAVPTVAAHHPFVGVEDSGDNGHVYPRQKHRQPKRTKVTDRVKQREFKADPRISDCASSSLSIAH